VPPVGRWDEVLRAEDTLAYQLLVGIGRFVWLRRLLGLPSQFAVDPGPSLEQREAQVRTIERTWLARAVRAVFGGPGFRERRVGERDERDMPVVGPRLSREIDAGLDLLSSMAFEEVQRRGWHIQPKHFYWPLNDLAFLRDHPHLWREPKLPGCIEWDVEGQMKLVERLAMYANELADVRDGAPDRPGEFTWGQGFGGLDAYAYYGLVRDLKPARVVEVGIGLSSLLLHRAILANERKCDVTLIDPGPPWHVMGDVPGGWRLLPDFVHDVDLDVFSRLEAGDVLFYDGSHCVQTGSDVNWMFFEVLPRLQKGVWIHIHDVSFPRDYAEAWIFDEGFSWNEQYLVQAFLMYNDSYRVRLGSVLLHHQQGPVLEQLFPTNISGASSIWLEKVA